MNSGGGNPGESPGAGGPETDLPPDLKSFEAALASLVPRDDRPDYGMTMFLAGRASVQREARPRATVRRAAWPAAFGAMTTVAAVLMVMLVCRPHLPVEEDAAPVAAVRDDREPAAPGRVKRLPVENEPEQPRPETPYHRQLDWILAQGPESWAAAPQAAATRGGGTVVPTSYRQFLDTLLEASAGGKPMPDRPPATFPQIPGVDS